MNKTVIVAVSEVKEVQLWKSIFSSLDFKFIETPLKQELIESRINEFASELLLLDLKIKEFNPYLFCRQISKDFPDLPIVFTNCQQTLGFQAQYRWALSQGAKEIIPSLSSKPNELISALRTILSVLKCNSSLSKTIVDNLAKDLKNNEGINNQSKAIKGLSFSDYVYDEMINSSELEIKDRRWRLRLYKKCFIGAEAVTYLSNRFKISRGEAVKLGQICLSKGYFYHVHQEHDFKDDFLFYRFQKHELPSKRILIN